MTRYAKQPLAQLLTQACKAYGIVDVVISPGSRNAPLTLGFTLDDTYRCYSIVDERCAAFFALGMAQQRQQPVALVCTSGSALLNYYPAIAEAYYSDIPLVVISADRPSNKIDIGDGQTIRQKGVYGHHIIGEANLSTLYEDNTQRLVKVICQSIAKQGPVHINVPFDEPLYELTNQLTEQWSFPSYEPINYQIYSSDFEDFTMRWRHTKKKMVLVGTMPLNKIELYHLNSLIADDAVLVFTETLSNLHHQDILPGIDKILNSISEEGHKALQPEILLTFGGMIISKKIKMFLRNYPPKYHFHIDEKKAYDTYFCLTHHFKCSPDTFLEQLIALDYTTESNYKKRWVDYKYQIDCLHRDYLSTIAYSDMWVYEQLFKNIPDNTVVQLANSSVVRYAQLFNQRPSLQFFANRGTSGIDGSSSTAIGGSIVCEQPTTLITGDLSFFYDSNALWNDYIRADFRIIIINNGGGGIFRILQDKEEVINENFKRFFETSHELRAEPLANLYGLGYMMVENPHNLIDTLSIFYRPTTHPQLLEIVTPKEKNTNVLKEYFKYLKNNSQ